MADVTVNIRGDASQLKNTLNNVKPDSVNPSPIPQNPPQNPSDRVVSDDNGGILNQRKVAGDKNDIQGASSRMVEDIRREMQQRGVVFIPGSAAVNQITNEVARKYRTGRVNDINSFYDKQRKAASEDYTFLYDSIDEKYNKRLSDWSEATGYKKGSAEYDLYKRDFIDAPRNIELAKLKDEYDDYFKGQDKKRGEEVEGVEKDLVEILKSIEKQLGSKEDSSNPDSYLGRLREQQREAMMRRENAATEEEARAASEDIAGINAKIRRAMGVENPDDRKYATDPIFSAGRGFTQMLGGIESGSISGMAMGGATAYAALSGMGLKSAMKMLGWVGLIAGVGDMLKKGAEESSERWEGFGTLTAMGAADGIRGSVGMTTLQDAANDFSMNGKTLSDLGLSQKDLADEATKRVRARGTVENAYENTIEQISTEKVYGLDRGALIKGSQYDRYGINVVDGITRMVNILENIKGSGVSSNDFSRVQEKYDLQQQIMSSFMNRADKPDYDVANKSLAAFSAVKGITQDSRLGSDYQTFQNAIQNPMNERMQALIYGTVSKAHPELKGRSDLIDRFIKDPNNEGELMQSVVRELQSQFGGTDTQMGYWVFKSLFPNISPDRLDKYVSSISNGDAGDILSGKTILKATTGESIEEKSRADIDAVVPKATDYTSDLQDIKKTISNFFDWAKDQVFRHGSDSYFNQTY